jgi:hypothetical protein
VTWSLLFLPSLSSVAHAAEFLNDGDSVSGPIQNGGVVEGDGAPGDDSDGDPGDSGDGYGADNQSDQVGPGGGLGNGDSIFLDEFILILMSLCKLVL